MLAIDEAIKPTNAFDVVVRSNTKFLTCRGRNAANLYGFDLDSGAPQNGGQFWSGTNT